MDAKKKARLEAAGLSVGTVQDFLGLTDAEAQLIEMKLALGRGVKERRKLRRMSQAQLAALIGSTQPRVANLERGSASMDMLTRTLLALGASRDDVGELLAA